MKSFVIRLDGCRCYLNEEPDGSYVLLGLLTWRSEDRRQGAAKRLLRSVRKWAHKTGNTVSLFVEPYHDRPVNSLDLICFYSRMGFRIVKERSQCTAWMEIRP